MSVESNRVCFFAPATCYNTLRLIPIVTSGGNVWQGDGTIGYELNGNNIEMFIRNEYTGSNLRFDSTNGDVHVYAAKNDSIVQLHAGGGRVLHLGANGLQYYNGSTWSTLKLSNGQDSN